MGALKQYIKNKIKKHLGITQIEKDLKSIMNLQASLAINNLNIPKECKESISLLYFPTPRGVIMLKDSTLIKAYLSLIKPIYSSSIVLSRIGGENDGGYVMATPPLQ